MSDAVDQNKKTKGDDEEKHNGGGSSTTNNNQRLNWDNVSTVGREKEMQQITEILQRVVLVKDSMGKDVKTKSEILIVNGHSGTGKSSLIHHVINQHKEHAVKETSAAAIQASYNSDNNGGFFFVKGKYDQNSHGSDRPLSAIVDATSELCGAIMESGYKDAMVSSVFSTLDEEELTVLQQLIPDLGCLIGDDSSECSIDTSYDSDNHSIASSHEEKSDISESNLFRSLSIFRKFLVALFSNSNCNKKLVMVVDDLQWADDMSRLLLKSIFADRRIKNILFIGAVRLGESTSFHVLKSAIMPSHAIKIESLTEDSVNQLISKVLRMETEKTMDLAKLISNRTYGNPMLLKGFMDSLCRSGLLVHNSKTCGGEGCYIWDEQNIIEQTDVSMDVIDFMLKTIESMEYKTQIILVVASILGHKFSSIVLVPLLNSFDLICLFPSKLGRQYESGKHGTASIENLALTYLDEEQIQNALDDACQQGMIEHVGKGKYHFTHDRVQQSAAKLLPDGEIGRKIRVLLGTIILTHCRKRKSSRWLRFTAVDLLIENAQSDDMDDANLADLCYKTAVAAAKQTAYKASARYADIGCKKIKQSVDDNYELALLLFTHSAQMHSNMGNNELCIRRCKAVHQIAHTPKDKFSVTIAYIHSLFIVDFNSAMETGFVLLNELGYCKLSEKSSPLVMLKGLLQILKVTRKKSANEVVQQLPVNSDPHFTETMTLLFALASKALMCGNNNVMIQAVMGQMTKSLEYGVTPYLGSAIVSIGILFAKMGNLKKAHEYGKMSTEIAISSKNAWQHTEPAIQYASNGFLLYLQQPALIGLVEYRNCIDKALKEGFVTRSCVCMMMSGYMTVFVGSKLLETKNIINSYYETMIEYKMYSDLIDLMPWQQFCARLCDPDGSFSIDACFTDEDGKVWHLPPEECSTAIELGRAVRREILIHTARLTLLYTCGQYETAEADRVACVSYKEDQSSSIAVTLRAALTTLNCYAVAIQTGDKKYLKTIKPDVKLIKMYASGGSPDMAPLYDFICAEKFSFQKKYANASKLYDRAIAGFHDSQWYLLECMCTDRLAIVQYYYAKNTVDGERLLRNSYNKFEDYGAKLKIECMHKEHSAVDFGGQCIC